MKQKRAVHLGGELKIVGRGQGGHAFRAGKRHELVEHELRGVRIQVPRGLVGKQNARAVGERAGDRDALLLAAR